MREEQADVDPVEVLRRWEERGAVWRVLGRSSSGLEVALLTCDGGEEVDRLVSDDAALADYVARAGESAQRPPSTRRLRWSSPDSPYG